MALKKVVVECKPDELLARTLGLNKSEVSHQPNKGDVCNYLSRSNIPVAIIDEDPKSGQPKYLLTFKEVEDKFGIRKIQSKNKDKTILIIKPRLEEWILGRCKASRINPEKYFLPSDNKELKDVINYRLPHFENLLKALLKKDDQGIKYLQRQVKINQKNGKTIKRK